MAVSRSVFLRCALATGAAAICCVMAVGCQSGTSGMPEMKNPFAKKETEKAQPDGKDAALAAAGPDFLQQMNRGREMEKTGRLDEARDIYQGVIVKYPKLDEPYHRLGVVADRQKRYREAQALYTQAISIKPSAEVFNDLGYCLYLQGKLDKAESALRKAVSMMPANARFRNNLAMVYGYQGRYDEAMEEFRRGGSEADAYYNMAFVLAGRDDVDGAKDCFRLALATDPTHDKARNALKSFEDPKHALGGPTVAQDGRRWESYVTAAKREGAGAEQATYNAPVSKAESTASPAPSDSATPKTTRPDTQSMMRRARAMMAERMGE